MPFIDGPLAEKQFSIGTYKNASNASKTAAALASRFVRLASFGFGVGDATTLRRCGIGSNDSCSAALAAWLRGRLYDQSAIKEV